jgi:HEAT repeat protein
MDARSILNARRQLSACVLCVALIIPAVGRSDEAAIRLTVDLTQVCHRSGHSGLYFKLRIANESNAPVDFKVADLHLKVDGITMPVAPPNSEYGPFQGVVTDPSSEFGTKPVDLPYLQDAIVPSGESVEGWLAFDVSELPDGSSEPLGARECIVDGKFGAHRIRFDLGAAERDLLSSTARAAEIDKSVTVIELTCPRLNALNFSKFQDVLNRACPRHETCVVILKQAHVLIDEFVPYEMRSGGPADRRLVLVTQSRNARSAFFVCRHVQVRSTEADAAITALGDRLLSGMTLVAHLQSRVTENREAAIGVLSQHLGDDGVIEALTTATANPDAKVREAAVLALRWPSKHDAPANRPELWAPAIDELIRRLDDSEEAVRFAAVYTLKNLRARKAIAALKRLQADSDPFMKSAVIDFLKEMGELTPLAAALAKLALGDLDRSDYEALARARETTAVPALLHRLKFDDDHQAAKTLGEIGDRRALVPLIQKLQRGDKGVHPHEIPRALGKLGDARAVQPLLDALQAADQESTRWRFAIVESLLRLRAPAAIDLAKVELKYQKGDRKYDETTVLLDALGSSQNELVVPLIAPYLDDQEYAAGAAGSLWEMGFTKSIAEVEKRLLNPEFEFGRDIVRRLKWTRTPASIDMLRKIVAAGSKEVKEAAESELRILEAKDDKPATLEL